MNLEIYWKWSSQTAPPCFWGIFKSEGGGCSGRFVRYHQIWFSFFFITTFFGDFFLSPHFLVIKKGICSFFHQPWFFLPLSRIDCIFKYKKWLYLAESDFTNTGEGGSRQKWWHIHVIFWGCTKKNKNKLWWWKNVY